MTFSWPVRVYWEDTDAGGVVYHASYLRFLERARTEWARGRGLDQGALLREGGVALVVARMEVEWLRAARLDDLLDVTCAAGEGSGARVTLRQEVRRGAEALVRASVVVAAVRGGRPVRLPGAMRGA